MSSEPRSRPAPLAGTGFSDDEIELGRVSGVFGVRGEVRLHLHNRESVLLEGWWPVVLISPDGRRWAARLSARPGAGKRILGTLEGVVDREEARSLMEWRVGVAKADLPPTDDGEFYVWQVEGLPVLVEGRHLGEVVTLQRAGPADILVVDTADGELFVPLTREQVLELDLDGGRVVLHPDAVDPDAVEGS